MDDFNIQLDNTCINNLLLGGFKANNLYHIYGKEGTGKSTFGLFLAYLVAKKGYKILYIVTDTGLNLPRLKQISNEQFPKISRQIFVQKPESFQDQDRIINRLENFITDQFKLIVLDDLVSLMVKKSRIDSKTYLKKRMLSRQLALLKNISKTFGLIILIINQSSSIKAVDENNNDRSETPFYNQISTFYSDYDLEIRKLGNREFSKRKMVRIKPKITDIIEECEFTLTNTGIV
ncbi:MAG: ATPase domain-containing protein [Candidatus Helarchaeota archaeon]